MKAHENIGFLRTIPFFVAAGSFQDGTANQTPGLPAGLAPNDILLCLVENDNADGVVTAPTGYAAVTNSPQVDVTGVGSRLSVFWKLAVSGEVAPLVTRPGIDHIATQLLAFRGCITTGNPWDVTAGSNSFGTAISTPTVTTTGVNRLIVAIASTGLDAASTTEFSAWTNANLVSVTEITDNVGNSGDGGGFGAAVGLKATAGATGATTATAANSQPHGNLTIALRGFPG